MVGEALGQHRAHRLLGAAVGNRHRRAVGFGVDGEVGPEERADHSARNIRGGLGGCEIPVEVGRVVAFLRSSSCGGYGFGAGAGAAAAAGCAASGDGSGSGLSDRVRSQAITSARCLSLLMPANDMRVPGA